MHDRLRKKRLQVFHFLQDRQRCYLLINPHILCSLQLGTRELHAKLLLLIPPVNHSSIALELRTALNSSLLVSAAKYVFVDHPNGDKQFVSA